jgi:hypothetical protein
VESALTLPLTVFLILGTIQLFMMLQGRIMAEYAAFEAVRAGSRHHGDCKPMVHAALAALLPNVVSYMGEGTSGGSPAEKLAQAWRDRLQAPNSPQPKTRYKKGIDGNHTGPIVWLVREKPLVDEVPDPEDPNFDAPSGTGGGMRLEVRLVYWFALRIPFADWVMTRMFAANFGLDSFNRTNPLMPTQKKAVWNQDNAPNLDGLVSDEFFQRMNQKQYVFPIQATYGMRMMTPAKKRHFNQQDCFNPNEGD